MSINIYHMAYTVKRTKQAYAVKRTVWMWAFSDDNTHAVGRQWSQLFVNWERPHTEEHSDLSTAMNSQQTPLHHLERFDISSAFKHLSFNYKQNHGKGDQWLKDLCKQWAHRWAWEQPWPVYSQRANCSGTRWRDGPSAWCWERWQRCYKCPAAQPRAYQSDQTTIVWLNVSMLRSTLYRISTAYNETMYTDYTSSFMVNLLHHKRFSV